ncbi:MAG: type II secretion system F family protein [Anaerolineae bacterium]|nr:type II secretion system F family protein [Anaerolineae bacterium]
MLIWIVVGVVVVVGIIGMIALVRYGMRMSTSSGDVQLRLEEYAGRTTTLLTLEEIELSQPFSQRVLRPMLIKLAQAFSRLSPSRTKADVELKLELAGKPNNWGATEFFGIRIFVALILAVLIFLIVLVTKGGWAIPAGAVAAGIGYFLPLLWLRSKIRARQEEIVKSLPDALDLLTITVEAGMGFDGALQKVAEKWDNELSKGFAKVVQEMRLGIARRQALRNMDTTMGVADVTTFVAAIIQAETLGVSIAKILRIQSEQMRTRRRQRAEEKANQAPIKMLFPMVFLIFPALFIILLGPAVLIMIETFFIQ